MARTIKDIKKSMTDQFVADPVIRQKYDLSGDVSFDDAFSSVSLESILFFIVASAIYVLEVLFESFKTDVDNKVSTAVLASIPWYHQICLEYQHGDELIFDEATSQFRYASLDPSKQVVKFAACRDKGGGVLILVSGADSDGLPVALSNDILTSFRSYLNSRKPAGIIVDIYSYNPDEILLSVSIQYDNMVLNQDGSLISSPTVFPVEDAVTSYLQGIVYGGVFNKTRLIDAIQTARGVVDVKLIAVSAKPDTSDTFTTVSGNNYTALSGAFKATDLKSSISYVLQL